MKNTYVKMYLLASCLLVGSFFISCSKQISTAPIEKDCEYLRTLLPEASIDFSTAVDEGLDIDSFINDVKKNYVFYVERNQKNKFEDPDEKGIYNGAFVGAITYALQDALKKKNTHMTIKGKDAYLAHSYVNRVYVSDIYFEKDGEDFFVSNNLQNNISKGMKYTGDKKNVVQEYSDGKLVYRYIVFSEDLSLDTAEINLNGNNIKISVRREELLPREGKDLWYEENKNDLFIIAKTFQPHLQKNLEEFEKTINEICEKINNYETICFDFRGNNGGYVESFIPILASMIFGNINYDEDERVELLNDDFRSGERQLMTETIRNSFLLDGQNISKFYYLNKRERYYTFGKEKTDIKKTEFHGKVFVVMNTYTVSAAEVFICLLKKYFPNQVILIGEKSGGMADFSGVFPYLLPDSKIRLTLCCAENLESSILNSQYGWRGDTEGLFPDYWIFSESDIDGFVKSY